MSLRCCWICLSAYATGDHDPLLSHLGLRLTCLTPELHLTHCISSAARTGNPFYSALLTLGSCQWVVVFSHVVLSTHKGHLCQFWYLQVFQSFQFVYNLGIYFSYSEDFENSILEGAVCRYLLYYEWIQMYLHLICPVVWSLCFNGNTKVWGWSCEPEVHFQSRNGLGICVVLH